MKKTSLYVSFLLLFSIPLFTETLTEKEFICPIDNTVFTAQIHGSFSIFATRLDFRPLGAYTISGSFVECIKCGLAIEDGVSFTADEIKLLKKYVKSADFKALSYYESKIYKLAKEYEYLKKDKYLLGYTLLRASWDKDMFDEYLKNKMEMEAYNNFLDFIAYSSEKNEEYVQAQFICLDIERKHANFDLAIKRLELLMKMDLTKYNYAPIIIAKQKQLLKDKKTKEEYIN